jgi:hypothetical protein
MATALFPNFLYDDAQIAVNPSGTALTITKGDYVAFSGIWAIAANTGVAGWKTSGIGIALGNNPWYDELGSPRVNSALPLLVRGIVRVSGSSAVGDGSDVLCGLPVKPTTTSSGIVGQTGATGMSPILTTAAYGPVSGSLSGVAVGSVGGVARLVKVVAGGSTGQWEIMLTPQRPDFV